jgi:hypothetical protein
LPGQVLHQLGRLGAHAQGGFGRLQFLFHAGRLPGHQHHRGILDPQLGLVIQHAPRQ